MKRNETKALPSNVIPYHSILHSEGDYDAGPNIDAIAYMSGAMPPRQHNQEYVSLFPSIWLDYLSRTSVGFALSIRRS